MSQVEAIAPRVLFLASEALELAALPALLTIPAFIDRRQVAHDPFTLPENARARRYV